MRLLRFDVEGPYNGVYKHRIFQRLAARHIPPSLVVWFSAFCSKRAATIVVNSRRSETSELGQTELPRGSPFITDPKLFLNADLVQRELDQNGGTIALVDNYTARVVGITATGNQACLQAIVQQATNLENRSDASFEGTRPLSNQ